MRQWIYWCLMPWLLLGLQPIAAQEHDAFWALGYSRDHSDFANNIDVFFVNNELVIYDTTPYKGLPFAEFNISYSTDYGKKVFSCNGINLEDQNGLVVEGSAGFNDNFLHQYYESVGLPIIHGGLALPIVASEQSARLIHGKLAYADPPGSDGFPYMDGLYASIVAHEEGSTPIMTEKGSVMTADTLQWCGLTACRHANGRDWWVVMPSPRWSHYYVWLSDIEGVRLHHIDTMDMTLPSPGGMGQAAFSPDGSRYARVSMDRSNEAHLAVFYFDRCTGRLTGQRQFVYGYDVDAVGMAIAPNGRYLYAHEGDGFYQYDFHASDLEASQYRLGTWDRVKDQGFPTGPFMMQLAPDGKIYMSTTSGTHFLHVIHQPNLAGEACQLEQRGFELPVWNITIPNNPHYRLGPVDGSICDSLGLDNVPLAGWRADREGLNVDFTDVSWYEPETWLWTFGDGAMSTDTSPVHTYTDSGVYEVCLIVRNIHGADTMCKEVYVSDQLSSIKDVELGTDVVVSPNPVDDWVKVQWSERFEPNQLEVFTISGQMVMSLNAERGVDYIQFSTTDLASGAYMIVLRGRKDAVIKGLVKR